MAKKALPAPKPPPPRQLPLFLRRLDRITYLIVLALMVIFIPGQNLYTVYGMPDITASVHPEPVVFPTPALYPLKLPGSAAFPELTAGGVVVVDIDSGVKLYSKNGQQQFAPASTTKIMTALIGLERFTLDDILTVNTLVNDGTDMGLVTGERITFENLLYGLLIQSGNDAAYTIAENYPGGVAAFVQAMNDRAAEYRMDSSSFVNPTGFDDPGHTVTPEDLALLSRIALRNGVIRKMVALPQITVSDVTHSYYHPLTNVNQLLGKVPGVSGIKTGWTEEAGENLVTLVERDGHGIVIVILRSSDRFEETKLVIDWVFATHIWKNLAPVGDP